MGKGRTVSSEDIEEVEEQGIFNVASVLRSCLLEDSTVYDPSLACLRRSGCVLKGQRAH